MEVKSFTQLYKGITNSLRTDVEIGTAFNHLEVRGRDRVRFVKFKALWDTGAEKSVITKRVADALGLSATGQINVCHANGTTVVNTYFVSIGLPNRVVFPLLCVSEGVLSGFDVLIGMDIISRGDFAITCSHGVTKFTFQYPSTHDFDFVAENKLLHHTPAVAGEKVGRNDPCPCGSGKKFKHCCGKNL